MTCFDGRVAVVSGSSRGIGLAIAQRLAREGARVVLNARKEEELMRAVADLESQGGTAIGVAGNVAEADVPGRMMESALKTFGRLDILINNTGISPSYGPLLAAERAPFMRTFEVNVWSAIAMTQAAVSAGLGDHPSAAVVTVSTIGSRQVQPLIAPYIASKAALDVVNRVLARELGPRGIRVNAVAPGLVKTDMAKILWEGDKQRAEAELLPLQRIGQPEDVAAAVTFLASKDASWITGAILDVDGGRLLVGDEPRELIGAYELSASSRPMGSPSP